MVPVSRRGNHGTENLPCSHLTLAHETEMSVLQVLEAGCEIGVLAGWVPSKGSKNLFHASPWLLVAAGHLWCSLLMATPP